MKKILSNYIHLKTIHEQQNGRVAPYVLGWLLGVPASILILIYLIVR